METLPAIVIVLYLAGVTVFGMTLARKTKDARQWAVGGGTMGVLMIAVGIAGTRIGAGGTYGVAGNVISRGVWNLWWYGISTFLAMALVGAFFAIPYRRLRLQTVGEIFTKRFGGRRNQVFTSLCVQTEYLIVNVIEAYLIAVILIGLTKEALPMGIAVFIAAAILISYVTLGGLWGAATTNLIHCGVILFGFTTIGLMGIGQIGGWEAVKSAINLELATTERTESEWWGFMGMGAIPVVAMIFSVVIHTPAASIYTNFSTAARTEKILLPGFLLAGVIAMLMPFLAGLIGILTMAEYGSTAGLTGYANITRLATDINPLVGGLAVAAVLAAVISSGGPILLSSATMFVRDWLPFTRDFSTTEKLRAYRITTIIYGLVAALLAWGNQYAEISILDMLLFGFAMVVPPAIAVGYLIYWRGTTEEGAYWGMVTGYAAGLVWFVLIKVFVFSGFEAGDDAGWIRATLHYFFVHDGEGVDPSYVTTFVPLTVVPLVSIFTKKEDDKAEAFYDALSGKKELEASVLDT